METAAYPETQPRRVGPEAKDWCADAIADGRIIEIDVEATDGKLRRSFAWPDVMDQITEEVACVMRTEVDCRRGATGGLVRGEG